MTKGRLALFLLIASAAAAFFMLGGGELLRPDNLQALLARAQGLYEAQPLQTALGFFALYVAVTGLSLPGAAAMTLLAGAIFGLAWGVAIVSFASTIGATLAFFASRFLLRDWVQAKFGKRLQPVNEGVAREGAFYLFALRLVPAFPFVAVNLLMGLTPIRAWTYFWVSQLGMFAGTVAYVYAGTKLGEFRLSAGLLAAFALLGVFPPLAKRALDAAKARRVYSRWKKPARFERNLVVIGAGSAGLVSAYIAAAVKARVTLVEKHRMGGDCLNTGCVPSKALLRSAKLVSQMRNSGRYGIRSATVDFDFADVMERVQRVVRAIEPHDSAERYAGLGVECIQGEAKIVSPWEVDIRTAAGASFRLTTRSIVIAAGARPLVPPIPGIEAMDCLTSDTVWGLRALPPRLLVLGGGPIGSELAQAFARLGSKVTQVEMLPRLLPREDPEVSEMVRKQFTDEGIAVLVGHRAKQFLLEGGRKTLLCEHEDREVRVEFDVLLCALGRAANTAGYGLEELGIPVSAARTVQTNEFLQTSYPNIYACGDVAGPFQFTHVAAHQAWYASVNALFGALKMFRADYSVIPWATFTDPEVARVGLSETEARERGIAYEVSTYGIDDLDRAIADEAAFGMVKVLTVPGKDTILGATIVGEHAGDLIAEYVAAMRHGFGMNKILGTIHIYPTLAEANKYAAGVWKKAHAPQGVLRMAERFHAWMRG
ncbi:MAG: FAD-dependent oxidoreductase [Candidatus Parcubacteria bacterium]|nr:FAD-dependent oxidoreductase [Burkholderiales bacterium]